MIDLKDYEEELAAADMAVRRRRNGWASDRWYVGAHGNELAVEGYRALRVAYTELEKIVATQTEFITEMDEIIKQNMKMSKESMELGPKRSKG